MNSFDDDDEHAVDFDSWTPEQLSRASHRDLGTRDEIERMFKRHLLTSPACRSNLQLLLTKSSTTTRDYSLEIDAFDLLNQNPILGHMLLKYPSVLMEYLEASIVTAQQEIYSQQPHDNIDGGVKGSQGSASRVHARLIHLPPTCCKMSLGSLQATDVGQIVQCSGTVVRTTPVCMYESSRCYKCVGKQGCGKEFLVHADLEQRHNALVAPLRCMAGNQNCKGTKFRAEDNSSSHTDYQEVTIQESASQLGGSHVPRSLLIKLQHDLVDRCQPGDEVVIVGNLMAQWHQAPVADADCAVGMALRAYSIRVIQDKSSSAWSGDGQSGADLDEDKYRKEFVAFWEDPKHLSAPIAARDYICTAVCPKLYGMAVVKLALLMTLIGGVCQYDQDKSGGGDLWNVGGGEDEENDEPEPFQVIQNKPSAAPSAYYGDDRPQQAKRYNKGKSVQTRRRGQSHLLLVGDPGTGKSQFLRFAASICPRSVLTTGVGTTSAGLTCAAVRENGKEFSLEAGALVLADQGVCCIDEFGCIQDQDRTTIHEAMEQQTLSVAKAGIVCKLNCRATIVAVMNPKDCLYDNQASLSRNTGLGTPLLSRFDLIFKLVDSSDAERDSNVTTYLLNRAIQGSEVDTSSRKDDPMDAPWTMEKLRAYISHVRERFHPVISDDAAILLNRHYEKSRSSQSSTIPVTVRFLESLIRLSQAHARLMFRNQVTLDDAVAVIRVMECTAFAFGGFDGNVDNFEDILYCDPMTIEFSTQPDLDLLCFKAKILQRYQYGQLTPEEQRQVNEAMGEDYSCPDPYSNSSAAPTFGHWNTDGNNPKRRRQW